MNSHDQTPEPPVRRIDRILAFSSITLVGLSILCFIAVMIGTTMKTDMTTPVWSIVSALLLYGLPIGVGLFFVLLVTNMVRRTRATNASRPGRKG